MNVLTTITAPDTETAPAVKRRRMPAIFRASFWITEDPTPEYSRLDNLGGLVAA